MGKTSLLQYMILNDIYVIESVCFIDPNGDAVEQLLDYIPPHRVKEVIYFNPADTEHPIPISILEYVSHERQHLVVSSARSSNSCTKSSGIRYLETLGLSWPFY